MTFCANNSFSSSSFSGFGAKFGGFNKIGSFSGHLNQGTSCGNGNGGFTWGNNTSSNTNQTDFTLTGRNDKWVDRAGIAEKIDGGNGIDTVVLKTDSSVFVSVDVADGYKALIVNGEVVMYIKNVERVQMDNLTLVRNPVTGQCEVETPDNKPCDKNDAHIKHMIECGNKLFGYTGGCGSNTSGQTGQQDGGHCGTGTGGSNDGHISTGCGTSGWTGGHTNSGWTCGTNGGTTVNTDLGHCGTTTSHGDFGSIGFGSTCAPVTEFHAGC